jgi:putative GTP pyrophosphokinase
MRNLDLLRKSYEERKLTAERFAIRLGEQIGEIIAKNDISLAVPLEHRIKTWKSMSDKVDRLKMSVSDVAAVNDFVGLRAILLFKRDVVKVHDLLSAKLAVLSSEDTLERLGTEQFGYQSVHLQLKLPEDWHRVPTFADFIGLSAEVQVRTAAQHIWAAASHTLQYKQELAVPTPVRRSINRVAALLETVDLEFERVLQQRQDYTLIIDSSDEDSQLNVDLLRRILDASLPAKNRVDDEDYGNLLSDLLRKGVRSVRELNSLLTSRLSTALLEEQEIVKAFREDGKEVDGSIEVMYQGINRVVSPERIKQGVFRTHVGLVRSMLQKK